MCRCRIADVQAAAVRAVAAEDVQLGLHAAWRSASISRRPNFGSMASSASVSTMKVGGVSAGTGLVVTPSWRSGMP